MVLNFHLVFLLVFPVMYSLIMDRLLLSLSIVSGVSAAMLVVHFLVFYWLLVLQVFLYWLLGGHLQIALD